MSTLLIREGIFETNSSSTHALIFNNALNATNDKPKLLLDYLDAECRLCARDGRPIKDRRSHFYIDMNHYDLEFGNDTRIISDWLGRLELLLATILDNDLNILPEYLDAYQEICEIVARRIGSKRFRGFLFKLSNTDRPTDEESYFNVTTTLGQNYELSYIDSNTFSKACRNGCTGYEDFIFNDKYVIIYGNTGDTIFNKIYEIFRRENGYKVIL